MADGLQDAEFWLPSEFLTDDEILMDKENLHKSDDEYLLAELTRSTLLETHKPTYRTQNNEKSWVLSGSPQSTLSGLGSWSTNGSPDGPSQMPSPPRTPFVVKNDAWDLIHQAAGEIARLKMNSEGPTRGIAPRNQPRALSPIHPLLPVKTSPISGSYNNHSLPQRVAQANYNCQLNQTMKKPDSSVWGPQERWYYHNRGQRVGSGGGGYVENGRWDRQMGFAQSAWGPSQVQNQNRTQPSTGSGVRAVFLGGSRGGVKKGCAGTGVFLPQPLSYGNLSENRKKSGSSPAFMPPRSYRKAGSSTALIPARVVHALNKNSELMTNLGQPHAQPRFHDAVIPEYDLLMARRAALVAEQMASVRPGGARNHDIHLPQEWTY